MAKSWNAAKYDQSFPFVADAGRSLIDVLQPQPGEHVLDLGCGTGTLTAQIAATGARAIGIDRDAAMIERARAHAPNVEFSCADGEGFDLGHGRFDAVFSNAALHWMRRPADVLRCVRRALRDGGRFVGELGAAGNVATLTAALDDAREAAGHGPCPSVWFFPTAATYARLLEDAGLEPRMLLVFDRPTQLEPGVQGVAQWYRMFADVALADLTPDVRDAVIDDASSRAYARLACEGAAFADYRRLRFEAIAASATPLHR